MQTWTVYYRIGGPERFQWKKALPVQTKDEAQRQCSEVERMGYKALYERTDRLDSIGLPETWEV